MGFVWNAVKGFAAPYLTYGIAAAFALMLGVLGVIWWQKNSAEAKVAEQQITIDRQQGQIDGLNEKVAGKDSAIRALEDIHKETMERLSTLGKINEEINDAPASEDGPVAPVLDRALSGLSRLRNHGKPAPD